MFGDITRLKKGRSAHRVSSFDRSGRNSDWWELPPKESTIIADIKGPGKITHMWLTQQKHYREVLIKITWDNAEQPSVLCPLGDFFGLGHSIVNSYESYFFCASTPTNYARNRGCALNCYLPMPFKERAVIELVNESGEPHKQYFHIDYEKYEDISELGDDWGYLHAEFRRENPFGGWGHEILVNTPEADIANKEELAWKNNYVILETRGRGKYIGCNLSVTNFQGTWWGEGDDMIWVDGYKWPPDLHGTGSEDYFNQAWGMHDNRFLRNGSSIFEKKSGGYQTSYVFHVENPIYFNHEIKVTIEVGHGNHLRNEVSSVAYWYADRPYKVIDPPPVEKRMPVLKINGKWQIPDKNSPSKYTTKEIELNTEMQLMKKRWALKDHDKYTYIFGTIKDPKATDGKIILNTFISEKNPNRFDIPIGEILEGLNGENLIIEFYNELALKPEDINADHLVKAPDIPKFINLKGKISSISGQLSVSEEDDGSMKTMLKTDKEQLDLDAEIRNILESHNLHGEIKCELEILKKPNAAYLVHIRLAP
ncbi:MAG: glycoside hydrolase family 172 protein [Promethearchaeota archaeon]